MALTNENCRSCGGKSGDETEAVEGGTRCEECGAPVSPEDASNDYQPAERVMVNCPR